MSSNPHQVQVGHERCGGRNIWEHRVDQGCQPYAYRHVGAILKLFGVPMRISDYSQHVFSSLLMVKHMVIFAV
jgi:hypothetical protein